MSDVPNLLDGLEALLRTGDPRKARAAYDVGTAAAYGWESLPYPSDSVIETIIDGQPVRVLLVEPPPSYGPSWDECMAASPGLCQVCPGNDDGAARCQCV